MPLCRRGLLAYVYNGVSLTMNALVVGSGSYIVRLSVCDLHGPTCRKAGVEGFITNHSLRCTGTTQLFQKGVDRKLIKEFIGHVSDAVDAYAITSDEQHEAMSKILTSGGDVMR